jgi:hypothetical protein
MAQEGHFCDTYGAKRPCPSLRHEAAHANAHNMMRFGFQMAWLSKAIFATPMLRNDYFHR